MSLDLVLENLDALWASRQADRGVEAFTASADWLGYGVTHYDNQTSLTVYCPSGELPAPLRAIKSQIELAGLSVRVVVLERFQALAGAAAVAPSPADGSIQAGDAVLGQPNGAGPESGTVGALLRKPGDRTPWLLSANHTIAMNNQDPVSITTDAGGFSHPRCIRIGSGPCLADAAVVRLKGIRLTQIRLAHPGGLTSRVPWPVPTGPIPAVQFQKWGAASGKTSARLLSVRSRVTVDIPSIRGNVEFVDQIVVEGAFSKPGDSGSLVVEQSTGRPVGIVIAGDLRDGLTGRNLSVISPIAPILSHADLGGPFELLLEGETL